MASRSKPEQHAGNVVTPARRNPSRTSATASSASSSTADYMSPTQSTKNKAAAAIRSRSGSRSGLVDNHQARHQSAGMNLSTSPLPVGTRTDKADENVLVDGIEKIELEAGPRMMKSATTSVIQPETSSSSVSGATATMPDPSVSSAQQSAEQQPRGQSFSDPHDASPSDTDIPPERNYPMRPAEVGDEEAFLEWFHGTEPNPYSETATKFYWCCLLNWFTVGILHTMTSLDLDEKAKYTESPSGEAVTRDRRGKKSTTSDLIPVNHNVPDWVIAYIVGNPYGMWRHRICMVIVAKRAADWDTAMSQIVVYIAKALVMDGCAMGLVVAGTQYRFLWWDIASRRLFMVVPALLWTGGESITLETLVYSYTESLDEWDVNATSDSFRGVARRNLYRILKHLEQQTQSMVAEQQRGGKRLKIEERPDLLDAIFVEITEVWENIPGPSVPPSNGIHVPITKPQAKSTARGPLFEQGFSTGLANGERGRGQEGNTGNTSVDHSDLGDSESDEQARYQAMWDDLGDMDDVGKSACIFFHDFQRDYVIPGRRKDLIDGWAQGVVHDPASPEGVPSSTNDPITPSESEDL